MPQGTERWVDPSEVTVVSSGLLVLSAEPLAVEVSHCDPLSSLLSRPEPMYQDPVSPSFWELSDCQATPTPRSPPNCTCALEQVIWFQRAGVLMETEGQFTSMQRVVDKQR